MLTQAGKRDRRQLDARLKLTWFRQIIEIELRTLNLTASEHLLVRTAFWHWRQQRDGSTAVGNLDRLACLDAPEKLAGPLPQLTHTHRRHVLTVAHAPSATATSSRGYARSRPRQTRLSS
jgi:hypothetical protein